MQFKLIKQMTEDRMYYSYFMEDENNIFVPGTLTVCRKNADSDGHAKAMQECEEKLKMVLMPREKEIIKTLEL